MPNRIRPDALVDTPIIFDACCLINLGVSAFLLAILQSLGRPLIVASYVAKQELRRLSLQPLIDAGQLLLTDVASDAEKLDWLTYAATYDLEEGEAITGAIARSRGWMIATDEGKAIEAFKHTIPDGVVLTTPDLVHHWANTTAPSASTLRQVLDDIQTKGNYYPGKRHSLHAWWKSNSPFRPFQP